MLGTGTELAHRVVGGLHEAVGVLWIDPPAEADLDPYATVLAVELDGRAGAVPGVGPVLTDGRRLGAAHTTEAAGPHGGPAARGRRAVGQPVKPAVIEVNCQLFWLMPEQLLTTPPPGHGRSRLTDQNARRAM